MKVPCEIGRCAFRDAQPGRKLQRDCSLIAGMIINMAELSYEVGDCPYATMAAINEIGFANSIVVEAEGLSVAAEAFGLGSDEKPEDLLT